MARPFLAPYSDRLSWVLPDFTRVLWLENESKLLWQPRLKQLARLHKELEWRAVIAGVRGCALTFRALDSLEQENQMLARYGLIAEQVQVQATGSGAYVNGSRAARPGESYMSRIVIGHSVEVRRFKEAWHAKDNDKIGELLGYPMCCRKFFLKYWVEQRCIDTTWPMAIESVGRVSVRQLEVEGVLATNIFWRWVGVRAVPHLPCSFNCKATAEFAKRLRCHAEESGYAEQLHWLDELLNMPVEWSALHGIAKIANPLLRIITQTDATAGRYAVRWMGSCHSACEPQPGQGR